MATSSDDREGTEQVPRAQRTGQQGRFWFPMGYKESFGQWWAGLTPAQTEYKVLSYVPYIKKPPAEILSAPASKCSSSNDLTTTSQGSDLSRASTIEDPYGPRKWYTNLVKLSGKDRAIHEYIVEREGEQVKNNLVMLHGYGAGLGFFYRNFEALSRLPGWRLYALDLLGMGSSSRPNFKIHAKDKEGKIREAENFFIDALEEWRIEKKIEKFTLLGHSLGGYMAVAYALKYPGRLNKLILVSPVGIPVDPYAENEDLPEPETSTVQNEFTNNAQDISDPKKPKVEAPRRPIPGWVTYLWDSNVSPFSLVRLGGPLGPSLVSGWTTRRFAHLPPEQSQALHDYSYSLFRQKGSGEYALAYVLAPGAFARSPLIRRIQGVGRQLLEPHDVPTADGDPGKSYEKREHGIPVVFMYGDQDWMDVGGGRDSVVKLLEAKQEALKGKTAAEKSQDKGDAKVVIVKNAGHHLYLDGHEEFNQIMLKELKAVDKDQSKSS